MAFGNKDNLEFLLSVADVLLLDSKTGTQLASATLKSHSMNQTVDTTEIRAGQANDVLATIKNNKTIEVTIEDVQQKHEFIAMMLGAQMQTGATVDAYVLPQGLVVASNKVQLPQTPKEGEEIVVTKANGEVVALAQGPISVGGSDVSANGSQKRTSITTTLLMVTLRKSLSQEVV